MRRGDLLYRVHLDGEDEGEPGAQAVVERVQVGELWAGEGRQVGFVEPDGMSVWVTEDPRTGSRGGADNVTTFHAAEAEADTAVDALFLAEVGQARTEPRVRRVRS